MTEDESQYLYDAIVAQMELFNKPRFDGGGRATRRQDLATSTNMSGHLHAAGPSRRST